VDRPCRYSSGNTSLTYGAVWHQAGMITEENRIRSPVTGSMRLSLTRGCLTGTAPAAVVTSSLEDLRREGALVTSPPRAIRQGLIIARGRRPKSTESGDGRVARKPSLWPMRFSESAILAASVEDSFDYVTDQAKLAEWNDHVQSAEVIGGEPVRVGSLLRQQRW
jgi:hypothetical protein